MRVSETQVWSGVRCTSPGWLDHWSYARSALRLAVMAASDPSVDSDHLWHIWAFPIHGCPSLKTADFTWLLEFVLHAQETDDESAAADGLLVLSQLPEISSRVKNVYFVETIIWAMGSTSPVLRHAALRVAESVRSALCDPPEGAVRMRLFADSDFLAALRLAGSSIAPPSPSDLTGLLSPDTSVYLAQSYAYVRIIHALVQSNSWHKYLSDEGHLERCLDVAQELHDARMGRFSANISCYLVALFNHPNFLSNYASSPSNNGRYVYEVVWSHVSQAWNYYHSFQIPGDLIGQWRDTLRPSIEFTRELIGRDCDRTTDALQRDIKRTYALLQHYQRLQEDIGLSASDMLTLESLVTLAEGDTAWNDLSRQC
ncbi:hypothetical protein BV22DRAFT_818346 [Leucogyrophana mollusca]|uniref:Uncharacterized protein n=1 Tax=Leucogyrophana mollusca TaxID=85980 RepID=A0ACB8B3F6_9AGAM|nr:hypothetical protein BV22DRAFT_818346 [Leucogyrophana mollusca]